MLWFNTQIQRLKVILKIFWKKKKIKEFNMIKDVDEGRAWTDII